MQTSKRGNGSLLIAAELMIHVNSWTSYETCVYSPAVLCTNKIAHSNHVPDLCRLSDCSLSKGTYTTETLKRRHVI